MHGAVQQAVAVPHDRVACATWFRFNGRDARPFIKESNVDALQSSGSTGGLPPVEMNAEAPPSGGESEEGVNEAVTTISGKAAQEGPPGREKRTREDSPSRSKDPAGGGHAGCSEGKEEVDPGTQLLREETDDPAHLAEERAHSHGKHPDRVMELHSRRSDSLEGGADRHHGKAEGLRGKAADAHAGGDRALAGSLQAAARQVEGKADDMEAKAGHSCPC